jgi:hypothetical protein
MKQQAGDASGLDRADGSDPNVEPMSIVITY